MKAHSSVAFLFITGALASPVPGPQVVGPVSVAAPPPVVGLEPDKPQAQPVVEPLEILEGQPIGQPIQEPQVDLPMEIYTESSSPDAIPIDSEYAYSIAAQSGPGAIPVPAVLPEPPAVTDPAPPPEQCPENAEWTTCGTACPSRCFALPADFCTDQCVVGCQCKSGYVLNANGDCVTPLGCFAGIFGGVS